jgi:ABC-2 type transport system ATP-binding protein
MLGYAETNHLDETTTRRFGGTDVAIDGLRVRRGDRLVLDDLALNVRAGSVTGLLGPSGSGKTTLIRAIVGVQIVESGTVTVLGRPAGSADLRSRVGYVTQAPSVYGDLTVRENLRYFARILAAPPARIGEVLATVGLERAADQLVWSLSGGQRARVSLATALLNDPDVLVLDEPTVGLDPVLRRDLWETFSGLAAGGTTLLVSSHVMDEAARCDELLLLRGGRLLAALSPGELRARTGEDDLETAFLHLAQEADA